VFIQFTATDAMDAAVPGEPYSFSVLKQAQALGDYEALLTHKRRALRVALGGNIEGGLRKALTVVKADAPAPVAKKTAKKAAAKSAAGKKSAKKVAGKKAAGKKTTKKAAGKKSARKAGRR
jgi:hypothetical protein